MLTREKAMLASFSPVHNGPLTRARQAPSNMPSAAEAKPELLLNAADGEKPKEEEAGHAHGGMPGGMPGM